MAGVASTRQLLADSAQPGRGEECERVDEGGDPSTAVRDELDVVTRHE